MVRDGLATVGGGALALVLALRLADGSYTSLVQSWYGPVLAASAVILAGLAILSGWRLYRAGGRAGIGFRPLALVALLLAVVPLGLGLAYQPRPLTGASLEEDTDEVTWATDVSSSADPARRNVYQWAYEFATADPAAIIGQQVDLVAFVHHREEASAGQFEAARFVVACCVADARGYTLPVQWAASADLPANQWVRVIGQVAIGSDGSVLVQASTVELLSAPSNPYIYP